MAVKTPELEEPVYQQQQMAAPPMPTGQQAQPLPPQAGYVSKAGAGAYIANSVLQGWLKGREIATQRNLQKAQTELGSWDRMVREKVAQANQARQMTYQAPPTLPDGKPNPDYLKAKAVADQAASDMTQAYNGYLAAQKKYAMPEQKPKGKGGKGAGAKEAMGNWFSQAFGKGATEAHIVPQMALAMAEKTGPPGYGPTPQEMEWKQNLDKQRADEAAAAEKAAEQKILDEQAAKLHEAQALPKDKRSAEQQTLVQSDWNAKYAAMKTVDPVKANEMLAEQHREEGTATPQEMELLKMKPLPAEKPETKTLSGTYVDELVERQPDGSWKVVAKVPKVPGAGKEGKEDTKEAKRIAAAKKAVSDAVNLVTTAGMWNKPPGEVEKIVRYYYEPVKTATGKTTGWMPRAEGSQSSVPDPKMAAEVNDAVFMRLKKGPPPRTDKEVTELLELVGVGQKPGTAQMAAPPGAGAAATGKKTGTPPPLAKGTTAAGQTNEFGFVPIQ